MENYKGNIIINKKKNHQIFEKENFLIEKTREERGLKEPNNEKELKKEESDNINKENQINVEEHKKENDLVLEKEKQLKTI